MAETNRTITKAEYNNQTYDIGATFGHVFVDENNSWTLEDFYNYLKDFLDIPLFTYYGTKTPELNNINIWYDTSISEEINTQTQG